LAARLARSVDSDMVAQEHLYPALAGVEQRRRSGDHVNDADHAERGRRDHGPGAGKITTLPRAVLCRWPSSQAGSPAKSQSKLTSKAWPKFTRCEGPAAAACFVFPPSPQRTFGRRGSMRHRPRCDAQLSLRHSRPIRKFLVRLLRPLMRDQGPLNS
jgi:hypothetical protein